MIEERLLELERAAEWRVHAARDRELDAGGPGTARRASAAMDAPMLAVAEIRKLRRHFGDLRTAIDHQRTLLRKTNRAPDLPPEVRRFRIREGEARLAQLESDYKALQSETERLFPATRPPAVSATSSSAVPVRTGDEDPVVEQETRIPKSKSSEDPYGFGAPQPEVFLGSLVTESELAVDDRAGEAPEFLVPGQQRLHEGNSSAAGRIAGAAALMLSDLFDGPYGIAHEDLGPLVNQSVEDIDTPIFGLIRTFNQILLEGGSQLGDLALRTLAAPIVGGAAAVGQAAIELGMTKTQARRLVRDLFALVDSRAGVSGAGASGLGALARKGRRRTPNDVSGGISRWLFDEAEMTGVLENFLHQFPPDWRSAIKEQLRKAYDQGRDAATAEVRRRGLGRVLSEIGGPLAERKLKQFEHQWTDRSKPINPNRIYGSTFAELPEDAQGDVRWATNKAFGGAGERYAFDLALKMDPDAQAQVRVETPQGFSNRRFDFVARRWSDRATEAVHELYAYVRGRNVSYRARPHHYEAKIGKTDGPAGQRNADAALRANPRQFGEPPVEMIRDIRLFDEQVPLDKALQFTEQTLTRLVERGKIDISAKEALIGAMISMREGGKRTITLADYADLYTRYVPAALIGGRNTPETQERK